MATGEIVLRTNRLTTLIEGDAVVPGGEHVTIDGEVLGDLTVEQGATLFLAGLVLGTLTVLEGAHAEVSGLVKKDVLNSGELVVSGKVDGALRERAGSSSKILPEALIVGGKSTEQ